MLVLSEVSLESDYTTISILVKVPNSTEDWIVPRGTDCQWHLYKANAILNRLFHIRKANLSVRLVTYSSY